MYIITGDGNPALPEPDCETDCVIWMEDGGRSLLLSSPGLGPDKLGVLSSLSLLPIISGVESRLSSPYK